MKTIHYPNKLRPHQVTIVPMAPFTPKSTSKLRSGLHFRYSIVSHPMLHFFSYNCPMLLTIITGCGLNARPLAPSDWDFLWATGICFTGRPWGDRIL